MNMAAIEIKLASKLNLLRTPDRNVAVIKIGPDVVPQLSSWCLDEKNVALTRDPTMSPLPFRWFGCPLVRDMGVPDGEAWIVSGRDGRDLGKVYVAD